MAEPQKVSGLRGSLVYLHGCSVLTGILFLWNCRHLGYPHWFHHRGKLATRNIWRHYGWFHVWVVTAVTAMKRMVFWVVTTRILERDQGFEGIYSLHFQLSVSFYSFLAWFTLLPWRLRRYIPPKCRLPFTGDKTYMAKWFELQFNIPETVWARRESQSDVRCLGRVLFARTPTAAFTKGEDRPVYPWQWVSGNKITFEIINSLEINDTWLTWGAIDMALGSFGTFAPNAAQA